jgi:hypothetical protein
MAKWLAAFMDEGFNKTKGFFIRLAQTSCI